MVRPRIGGIGGAREGNFTVSNAERIKSKFQRKAMDGSMTDVYQLHIVLEHLDGNWKPQHEWYGESNTEPSAYWDIIKQLIKLGVITATQTDEADNLEDLTDLVCENLKGKSFHFEERRIGNKRSNAWFPVSEVEEGAEKPEIEEVKITSKKRR